KVPIDRTGAFTTPPAVTFDFSRNYWLYRRVDSTRRRPVSNSSLSERVGGLERFENWTHLSDLLQPARSRYEAALDTADKRKAMTVPTGFFECSTNCGLRIPWTKLTLFSSLASTSSRRLRRGNWARPRAHARKFRKNVRFCNWD